MKALITILLLSLCFNAFSQEAIDTIPTKDKYTKIVLFSDHTWKYLELGKPQLDEKIFQQGWTNDTIHPFKHLDLKTLPDEIDLMLVDSTHQFCAPAVGYIRSKFCFRKTREHKGVDIPMKIGDPVYAAFDGKVRVVMGPSQSGGYGNLVVIRHANGLETYYGHLSRHAVLPNDIVKAGEVIGYAGNTGRSTGPHLHFETRYFSQPFDPERIIDFSTGALRDTLFTLKKHYFSIYSHYGQTDEESIAASQRIVHIIRSGDTLGALAAKYGTTVKRICQLNGISQNKTLRIGERIIVR